MGAKQSAQGARKAELDITDIASNKPPPKAATAASATHTAALSSASTSPALTSLSSTKHSKLAQQAWGAPQQARYVQSDKPEDAVTEWKPEEEEKEEEGQPKAGSGGQAGEDLFGKYKSGAGASGGEGSLGKRSGIVSGVKAASGARQPPPQTSSGLHALMEDEEGVDDSALSFLHKDAPPSVTVAGGDNGKLRPRMHSIVGPKLAETEF